MARIPAATWFAPQKVRTPSRRWAPGAGRPPRRHFARPRLEALEDRTVPTTLVVSPGGVVPGSFASIQAAVNAAASGDTVLVDPGTYQEQVTISKSLTLQGNGAGAIIQAPSTMTADSFNLRVLLEINSAATVNVNNMAIEGPNPAIDEGILVVGGATANVTGSMIANINRGASSFGVQTGIGILVGGSAAQAVGQVGQATITDCTVTAYQKGGIVIGRSGSSGQITGSTVTGIGPTPLTAQNGIQISPGAASSTVSNNTISGNEFTGTGSGPDPFTATQAAGILDLAGPNSIAGNTVVSNDIGIDSTNSVTTGAGTTISGNTVQGSFEGILIGQGATSVSNNTITGNNVGVLVAAFAGDTANAVGALVSNNITNNGNGGLSFPGGGILLQNESGATTTAVLTAANFNRIVGNSVGLNNTTANTVDATNNWWGSNAGPGGAGSDTVTGPAAFNPWLVLQATASPDSVPEGGAATVVASLTTNSAGMDASALGHVPDGIPVSFGAVLGTISPTTGATVAGKATATFTAGTSPGAATVSATVDNQTVSTAVNIVTSNILTSPPPPYVSVAFSPAGQQVIELVNSAGVLTQFDASGAHVFGGGARAASVAFDASGHQVLLITYVTGALVQFDAAGAHVLAPAGVSNASIAFGPAGEAIDVVDSAGVLTQFDASGAHTIGGGVRTADVTFGPTGEVRVVAFQNGGSAQYDAAGAHELAPPGSGVISSAVAFAPSGQVLDVIFSDDSLWQFDAFGAHRLGTIL